MKRIILIISILSFAVMYSCDMFTTRDPQQPQATSSNFIAATTPEILFQNLKSSVEEKVIENYMACFVDSSYLKRSFNFIPAGGVITQYPVLNTWSLQAERQYFNNLKTNLQQSSKITLNYSQNQLTPLGDSAIYVVDYELTVNTSNSSISGLYQGSSQFKIFLDSRNQWVIVDWEDIKKDDLSCWSELKGRTY